MISLKSKIYVSGHKGLVGSAIVRKLQSMGYKNVICKTRKELDLTNQNKVLVFLKKTKPDFIFWLRQKLGAFTQTTNIKQITFMRIYQFKQILFIQHICVELKILFF